jgi:hypothetical protein
MLPLSPQVELILEQVAYDFVIFAISRSNPGLARALPDSSQFLVQDLPALKQVVSSLREGDISGAVSLLFARFPGALTELETVLGANPATPSKADALDHLSQTQGK